MHSIRVLLVDDQAQVRKGLRMLLAAEPAIEIVGESSNGREALGMIEASQPDLVLMDVQMPVMDGISASREIAQHHPDVVVLLISLHDDEATRQDARAAGASALLSKDSAAEQLVSLLLKLAGASASDPS